MDDIDHWARAQLTRLLPLDPESLRQLLDHAANLSIQAAADHFKSFLGDSSAALDFIAEYGRRRQSLLGAQLNAPIPQSRARDQTQSQGVRAQQHGRLNTERPLDQGRCLQVNERTTPGNNAASPGPSRSSHLDVGGRQIFANLPNVRAKNPSARQGHLSPKVKVNVQGGVAGHGDSTILEDLDSAIRSLEIQTSPNLTANPQDAVKRHCDCNATRHPLLTSAPNCLKCGKIICLKEGLGPCTFCHAPILGHAQIQSMILSLRQERGHQKQQNQNAAVRRADPASHKPAAKGSTSVGTPNKDKSAGAFDDALAHRNTLLKYQSQNAQRTTVRDEAADVSTPISGQNMWTSPAERAQQLKSQQKILREMEWSAKPEYEKKQSVLSIELGKNGKGVKVLRENKILSPNDAPSAQSRAQDMDESNSKDEEPSPEHISHDRGRSTFSHNPLLDRAMVKPKWDLESSRISKRVQTANQHGTVAIPPKSERTIEAIEDKENVLSSSKVGQHMKAVTKNREQRWRRVQDDEDDNEAWILDGGIYGQTSVDGPENRHGGPV